MPIAFEIQQGLPFVFINLPNLPFSVVLLKDKHCQKPHCCYGVVDTFGLYLVKSMNLSGQNMNLYCQQMNSLGQNMKFPKFNSADTNEHGPN